MDWKSTLEKWIYGLSPREIVLAQSHKQRERESIYTAMNMVGSERVSVYQFE